MVEMVLNIARLLLLGEDWNKNHLCTQDTVHKAYSVYYHSSFIIVLCMLDKLGLG